MTFIMSKKKSSYFKKFLFLVVSRCPAYIVGFVIEIKDAEKVYKEINKDCACMCNYWPIANGW